MAKRIVVEPAIIGPPEEDLTIHLVSKHRVDEILNTTLWFQVFLTLAAVFLGYFLSNLTIYFKEEPEKAKLFLPHLVWPAIFSLILFIFAAIFGNRLWKLRGSYSKAEGK